MIAEERSGTGLRGLLEYVVYEKQGDEEAANESSYHLERPLGKDIYDRRFNPANQPGTSIPGGRQASQSIASLRSLRRGDLARIGASPSLLLPAYASGKLDPRSAATAAGVRRPGDLNQGAGGKEWSRVVKQSRSRKNREIRGQYIDGTLLGTPAEMARQAAPFRAARPDAKAPVMHFPLSLQAGDGRRTPEQWRPMVRRFLELMDFPLTGAWTSVLHDDTDHQHCHIVFLRSTGDGKLWNREFSAKRAIAATAQIEKEFGLLTHDRTPKRERRRQTAEQKSFEKQLRAEGKTMSKEHISKAIDQFLSANQGSSYTLEQMQAALADHGVKVEMSQHRGGKAGVKFEYEGVWVAGSSLGGQYKADSLLGAGLVNPFASATEQFEPAQQARQKTRKQQEHEERSESSAQVLGNLLAMPIEALLAIVRAIIHMINAMLGRREVMAGAPAMSLGRFSEATGKFTAGEVPPEGQPGYREALAAMDAVAPAIERATELVKANKWSELIEHGPAPYQFKEDGKESYFARLRLSGGEESTVWGVDLERALDTIDAQPGDRIQLDRVGRKQVTVREADEAGNIVERHTHRNAWEARKQDGEQETRPLPSTPAQPAPSSQLQEDRAKMRYAAICWLRDKAHFMAESFGSNSPQQQAVFSELATLGYGPTDELKYQEWLNNSGKGRYIEGEDHQDYILRREVEYLQTRLDFAERNPGSGGDVREVHQRLEQLNTEAQARQVERARDRQQGAA